LTVGHGYCTAFSPVHFPSQLRLTEKLLSFVFFVGTPLEVDKRAEGANRTSPLVFSDKRQV
jgi:hypothetical protein